MKKPNPESYSTVDDTSNIELRHAPPAFVLLVALSAASPFALHALAPAMPAMAEHFHVSYAVIQLILTLALVAFGSAQFVVGPLSDRFGRRPVILCGLVLFTCGSLVSALATATWVVIAGRVLQAAGGATSFVLARAIVHDTREPAAATTTISYMVMAMMLAPMAGSIAGSFLSETLGWRAIFWLIVAIGIVVFLATSLFLKETNRHAGSGRTLAMIAREGGRLLRMSAFLGYCGCSAFASGMFFSFIGIAPYLVEKVMGRPQTDYGLYFLIMSGGYVLGNFLSGRLSARLGPRRMLGLGVIFASIGIALFWLLIDIMHPLALFVPMAFITLSNGVTLPSATVGAMNVQPMLAGTASGINGAAQMAVSAVILSVIGHFVEFGSHVMVLALTVSFVLACLSYLLVRSSVGPVPAKE
ncbi:MAG: multidrug effflux MFS transporter [Hyphomicrobiaceae bacterium]